jgi:hypothetical protein
MEMVSTEIAILMEKIPRDRRNGAHGRGEEKVYGREGVTTLGILILASSFVAGFIWTAVVGGKLGIIAIVSVTVTAVALYLALGILPGFLEWMNLNDRLDSSIGFLIWAGFLSVPFFFGTVTRMIFNDYRRTDPTDRRSN